MTKVIIGRISKAKTNLQINAKTGVTIKVCLSNFLGIRYRISGVTKHKVKIKLTKFNLPTPRLR
ncbi:hypothetical protein ES705_17736 [subsurface metagenome]